MWCYTVEHYSAIKKNETMPFAATWMDLESIILSEVSKTDLESIILSEVSKTDKVKYRMILLICGIKKKTQVNLFV